MFDTSFWYLISFLIFVFLAFKPVRHLLTAGLDEKSAEIRKHLEEALETKKQALQLLEHAQRRAHEITIETQHTIEHAEREAARYHEDAKRDIALFIQNQEQQLRAQLDYLSQKASQEIHARMTDIAFQTAQSVIAETLTQGSIQEYTHHELKKIKHLG